MGFTKILALSALAAAICIMPASAQTVSAAFAALLEEERAIAWREDPLSATYEGVRGSDHRLPGATPADFARRRANDEALLSREQSKPRVAWQGGKIVESTRPN